MLEKVPTLYTALQMYNTHFRVGLVLFVFTGGAYLKKKKKKVPPHFRISFTTPNTRNVALNMGILRAV